MDTHRYGTIMSMPMPLTLSTLAIPSLEPIPGSEAPTPSLHEADDVPSPPPQAVESQSPIPDYASFGTAPSDYMTPPEDFASRRSSIISLHPVPGSYFPSPPGPSSRPFHMSPSASGTTTPADRPRPAPIAIPAATPDEPLFSAYPDQGPSRSNSKGKGRSFTFPLKPAFSLAHPPSRRQYDSERSGEASTGISTPTSVAEDSPSNRSPRLSLGRRRASTFSGSPPDPTPASEHRRHSLRVPKARSPGSRSLKSLGRRRVSIGTAEEIEPQYSNSNGTRWPSMPSEELRRFDRNPQPPYSYEQPGDSDYTLESISTVATVRPLSASPTIAARNSSLHLGQALSPPNSSHILLGLTNMPAGAHPPVEVVIPDDLVMPHDPPPRRSSLDYGNNAKMFVEPRTIPGSRPAPASQTDYGSTLSASLTGTDTSASAEFFSPSPSSKEHPLSSANTSLSRSAKSGKEGDGLTNEKDAALSAIRLQRSLEWEARQNRHRRMSEKKRMILLELVETEVAYTEDLKTLVQVYLPQLYALPSVSERTADLIARNAKDLLDIHIRLASQMVEVSKAEKLGYDPQPEPVVSGLLERASRKLAAIFVEEASPLLSVSVFSAYKEYCAGSIAAATLVRHISQRPDYDLFERRCQIISAHQPHSTLKDLLSEPDSGSSQSDIVSPPQSPVRSTPSNRNRLHFRDFLIMPIQRICRYPLLLNQLLGAATTPSPTEERERPEFPLDGDEDYDVGVDVERALGAMRGVAEEADEARRVKEADIKSATVMERLEYNSALPTSFLKSLGTCRLIGSLDVLHHHPTISPLVPPVKVKYLAAFLYRGYLILAKVKKGKAYEAKHFLPLEVFELIDITEGFLPHSIRLSLREHNFDLAASCETEKKVWAAALCQARDESTVPPFELPASVSAFAARPRRMSTAASRDLPPSAMVASKRHTLAFPPERGFEFPLPPKRSEEDLAYSVKTPATSPTRTSFSFTPDRPGRAGSSSILLRRASATQRALVDRSLLDVFSESCATARSKAQLHHALFLPDFPAAQPPDRLAHKDSTMIRRRRSFLDSRQASFDIAFNGEVRGSVMPIRQTRSVAGKRRTHHSIPSYGGEGKKFSLGGNESSTEVEGRVAAESADETATASDFGTMTRGGGGSTMITATPSSASGSRSQSPHAGPVPRRSLSDLRRASGMSESTSSLTNMLTLSRRKTASSYNLRRKTGAGRAKSVPVSPIHSPIYEREKDLPPIPMMPPPDDLIYRATKSRTLHDSQFRSNVPLQSASSSEDHGTADPAKEDVPDRSNAWSTLRRSMSFMRDRDVGSPKRPSLSRGSSSIDDGEMGDLSRGASTSGLSDSVEDDEPGGGEEGTPKRKRSVRIFHQLSRFTPM